MWLYHWFAEKWGWSPQQVDDLTLEQAHWFPLLTEAQGNAQAQLSDD
jgi:hypothetical protein